MPTLNEAEENAQFEFPVRQRNIAQSLVHFFLGEGRSGQQSLESLWVLASWQQSEPAMRRDGKPRELHRMTLKHTQKA